VGRRSFSFQPNQKTKYGKLSRFTTYLWYFFLLSKLSQIVLPHITVAPVGMPSREKLVCMVKVLVHFFEFTQGLGLIGFPP
jgi:hypothetical protein